nr:MAG TPA: hypothetical protein [Caudoviricetes sp.]
MFDLSYEVKEREKDAIERAVNRGNCAEVKIEHGKMVIIEIKRKKIS